MKPAFWFRLGLTGAALTLSGCARQSANEKAHDHATPSEHHEHDVAETPAAHDESATSRAHEHDHGDHDEADESGVTYVPGRGLRLSAAVTAALDLRTAAVSEQTLAATRPVTAQVYAVTPRVLASARLPADHTVEFESAVWTGARLVQIDRSAAAATSFVDLVFELPADPPHHPGDFVTLAPVLPATPHLAVPRTAVLESATGAFVYLVDGDSYRRTPVQTGASAGERIGITAGLRAGDRIVTTAVDQLWLAELRLTKGGGHSH